MATLRNAIRLKDVKLIMLVRLADLLLEFPDQPGFGRTKVCITSAVMASTTIAEQSVSALTSASERSS